MLRASAAAPLAALVGSLLLPGTALADLDNYFGIGVSFLPLTVRQWKANTLGAERVVEARGVRDSERTELHWRVAFVSANRHDVFAEESGVLQLSAERAECPSPPLFAELEPRLGRPGPPGEGRSYAALREKERSLHPAEGSTFFREASGAEMLPKAVPRTARFCDSIRDLCRRRRGERVSVVLPASLDLARLPPPTEVPVDCSRIDAEETSCSELADELDLEWAAALEGPRRQLELQWRCAALVFPVYWDDGSVEIAAWGRDGFVWASERVRPPWMGVGPEAWVYAPATLVGDVGVMTAQALWSAFVLTLFSLGP
jgi:hypothetical protein